jgi:hypothetical protein
MSFSGEPDDLGQWRGYAANGLGCSIVTYAGHVKRVADAAGWVLYDPAEQKRFALEILDRLQSESDPVVIEQVLVAAASYIKHEGFRSEKEFRLLKFPTPNTVRFREIGDRLAPFVDYLGDISEPLPIVKIVIGPGWQLDSLTKVDQARNHVMLGIERLLEARGLSGIGGVEVRPSAIPYDPR